MKVELTVTPKYLPGRPLTVSIPDSVEDIAQYVREFVTDQMLIVSVKVVAERT